MRCERLIDKEDVIRCSGPYCEPDYFDGARIAQNFSLEELNDRIIKVESDLRNKPESCNLQEAFNQLATARDMRKLSEGII